MIQPVSAIHLLRQQGFLLLVPLTHRAALHFVLRFVVMVIVIVIMIVIGNQIYG